MKKCIIKIALAVIVVMMTGESYSQEIGWRGPGRTGIYNETGLMKEWPSSGPALRGGRNYIHTPIYKDGYLFAASGYGQTAAKIKLNSDGKDPELVWKNPEINPHVGGMVLVGNYIYSSTHDNNSMGRWICVDWTTGETRWITAWNNKGSIISAEGLLYIYEEKNGNGALVRPNPEKLDIISSFQIAK